MKLEYALDGTGWATATLSDDQQSIAMTASYLHDSLAQLADAVFALQANRSETTVVFMDEPGEHQVTFRRQAGQYHFGTGAMVRRLGKLGNVPYRKLQGRV